MFVKASWIAIVAALCVAQMHTAQADKPANAVIGTSTLIRDASGKVIGSAANWYDKDKNFISSETTYFSNAPAAAPAVANEAVQVAKPAAGKPSGKPANAVIGTSTLIRDASGKVIGSAANWYDKDKNFISSETTYYSNAPAAAPAAAREGDSADAAPAAAREGDSADAAPAAAREGDSADAAPAAAREANSTDPAPVVEGEADRAAAAPAKPANAVIGTSTLIRDASGKVIGSAANWYDKDKNFISSETTYYSNAPAAAPAVANEAVQVAKPAAGKPSGKPANAVIGTSTLIRDASGKVIGSAANWYDKDKNFISSETTYYSNAPAAAPAAREADADASATVKAAE